MRKSEVSYRENVMRPDRAKARVSDFPVDSCRDHDGEIVRPKFVAGARIPSDVSLIPNLLELGELFRFVRATAPTCDGQ
jgi:hypothetical protein